MKSFVFSGVLLIQFIFYCQISLSQQMTLDLVVGTYTNAQPDTGIYIFSFDTLSGALVKKAWAKELVNPSFLCVHPESKVIYACTDTKLPRFGSVTGLEYLPGEIHLKVLNKQGSEGENPVFIKSFSRWVFNVNYNEGNLVVLEIQDDKTLKPNVQKIQFQGKSIHPKRQEKAHPHSIYFSKDKRFALVPDLGSDLIRVFEFNSLSNQPLLERTDLNFKSPAGSGPRHMVIHPNGKWIYCIEELSGTVSYFAFKRGKLKPVQRLSTYSASLEEYSGADIHCSPDGKFLYCSNRIENSLAIFKIDRKKGDLSLVGHQKTMGEVPRNFTIDPYGKFLIVANQGSSSLVVFKRNPLSGKLTQVGNPIYVSRPSCLDWIQIY
jgi:6-phosphogluconolactonase (cycloisomerase 2 family)